MPCTMPEFANKLSCPPNNIPAPATTIAPQSEKFSGSLKAFMLDLLLIKAWVYSKFLYFVQYYPLSRPQMLCCRAGIAVF